MWGCLETLLEVRARLPGYNADLDEDRAAVFLTWPGRTHQPMPMTNSSLDKAIKKIWAEAGQKKNMSATQLRKTAATTVDNVTYERYIENKLIDE